MAQKVSEVAIETDSGWYSFKHDTNLTAKEFLKTAVARFDLDSNYSFKVLWVKKDDLGFTHTRLRQYYKGIYIEGAEFILHEKNSRLKSMNGHLKRNVNLNVPPLLDEGTAITEAINYIDAEEYMWESNENNTLLKEILNDSSTTYYPNPELLIVRDKPDGADYKLAYKVDIYASDPFLKQDVFVDANLGEVLYSLNALHHADSNGLAHTKYSGIQNIITDHMAPHSLFRLRESTGGGIHTYDARNGMFPTKDFIDSNNVWNNVNAHKDEVATDVHWAAEQAYSYFLEKHNRSSFDNLNGTIISYVHSGNGDGAWWDGQTMHFSDGNLYGPSTSIDLVGHEFTHGVVQFTAALSYSAREAAALNESFCNIFGTMIEFYADSANGDYLFAEDIDTSGLGWSSLKDPQSLNGPDTYGGKYRSFSQHKNACIQDYFFYVLAEGDSGVNDHGHYYNIPGIGKEKAAQIMYRNLSYYLISGSFFKDSKNGAIAAARDIFGDCSDEASKVGEAWSAVGLGMPFGTQDISFQEVNIPALACHLDSSETIFGKLLFNDCSNTPSIGDSIIIGYQIDNNPPVIESAPLIVVPVGTTFSYSFQTPADFSAQKNYKFKIWIDYVHDQYPSNDTIYKTINHLFNSDFSAQRLINPESSCDITGLQQIEIGFNLENCPTTFNQEFIELGYQLDGNPPVRDTVILDGSLDIFTEYPFTFNKLEDFNSKGEYELTYWIHYPNDPNPSNDTVYNMRIQNSETIQSHYFNFENPITSVDSIFFLTDPDNRIHISTNVGYLGSKGLLFTGGHALMDYRPVLGLEWLKFDPWIYNHYYSSFACTCVNTRFWDSVKVEFDLKQTYSTIWDSINNESSPFTSSFRVTANGNQVSETFNPNSINSDLFSHHYLDLKSYAHSEFLLCLESRNLVSAEFDIKNDGDNTYVDNLWIYNDGNINLDETQTSERVWHIYPNPSKEEFTLSIFLDKTITDSYQIYNSSGKLMEERTFNMISGSNDIHISLNGFPSGLYYVVFLGCAEKLLKSE